MSDEFSTRYRLLKCVAVDENIQTHHAQEMASGRTVMVHIANAAPAEEVEALQAGLARLDASDRSTVLETATLPSGFAIVTEILPAGLSLRSWLAEHAQTDAVRVAPTLPTAGAFTQIFGGVKPNSQPANSVGERASSTESVPSAPPVPEAPPATQQGAFTQLFAPVARASGQAASAAPPDPASPPKVGPGEFTKLFTAPSLVAPLPDQSRVSPLNTEAAPAQSTLAPDRHHQAPPLTPLHRQSPLGQPAAGAVGFPSLHRPPVEGAATPSATSPLLESNKPFGSIPPVLVPPVFTDAAPSPLSSTGSAVPAGNAPSGPSDFTRVIRSAAGPVIPTVSKPDVKSGTVDNGAKRGMPTGLIIVINAVLIITILLVAFIWKRPATVPTKPQRPAVPKLGVLAPASATPATFRVVAVSATQ